MLCCAGLGVTKSRIIEVGAVALESGEEFSTLVNPKGVDIQLAAYQAHGISMADVQHASVPTFRCCLAAGRAAELQCSRVTT